MQKQRWICTGKLMLLWKGRSSGNSSARSMKRNGDYSSPRKLFKNTNIDATYLDSVYLHDIVFQKQDFGLCLTNQFLVLTMLCPWSQNSKVSYWEICSAWFISSFEILEVHFLVRRLIWWTNPVRINSFPCWFCDNLALTVWSNTTKWIFFWLIVQLELYATMH